MMNITSNLFNTSKKSNNTKRNKTSFMNTASVEQVDNSAWEPETSGLIVNPKVMEVWLNNILAEAQELGLKTAYMKPDKTKPISQFGIDRQTLAKHGLNMEQTNRIYRGLFVYSVGFFELIKKSADRWKSKTVMVATIWRVFAILLEYCCKTDYDILVSELTNTYQDEISKLKKNLEENQIIHMEKEQKIMDKCELLKMTAEAQDKKTSQYVKHIEKLNGYIDDLRSRNEEEINIRKQFEAKLNELHSVGRDQDIKYYRALEEIDDYTLKYESINKDMKKYEKESMELRKIKIQHETQIVNLENKCKILKQESINTTRTMNKQDKRIIQLDQQNEKHKKEWATYEKKLKEVTLNSNINEMKVDQLHSEVDDLKQKLKKRDLDLGTQAQEIEQITEKFKVAYKEKQIFERQFRSIQDEESHYTEKNKQLQEELTEVMEK